VAFDSSVRNTSSAIARAIPAAVLVLTALTTAACGADESMPLERFNQQVASAPQGTVLPSVLPPGLFEGSVSTIEGVPVVDFHSTNQPTVTVCAGTKDECAAIAPFNVVVRTAEVEGRPVVLSLSRTDDPAAGAPALKGDAEAFWSKVAFQTGKPEWAAD
jgi:hypothetical protein